jgi:winged helix-turn-helix protein
MARVCTAAAHLSVEEVETRIKHQREAWRIRRWMVIRHALVDPQPAAVIAVHVGLAPQTVRNLLWAYNCRGPAGIDTVGKGQRQRASLSLTQEQALVRKFVKKSAVGQVSTGIMLKPVLEKAVGRRVAKTTVYRILKRHQWRKVVPRPRHPDSTPELQTAFKKTSHTRWPRSSRRGPHTIPAPC